MNHKISFALLALSVLGGSAFAQEFTWPSYPGESRQEVTVCDMRLPSYKKAEALCSHYQLDVRRAQEGAQLFKCDCSHIPTSGPTR